MGAILEVRTVAYIRAAFRRSCSRSCWKVWCITALGNRDKGSDVQKEEKKVAVEEEEEEKEEEVIRVEGSLTDGVLPLPHGLIHKYLCLLRNVQLSQVCLGRS